MGALISVIIAFALAMRGASYVEAGKVPSACVCFFFALLFIVLMVFTIIGYSQEETKQEKAAEKKASSMEHDQQN